MEILSRARRADVTFHRSGRIEISKNTASTLGLRNGDAINAAVSNNGDTYIYICGKHTPGRRDLRGVCRRNDGYTFRAFSKPLTSAFVGETKDKAEYVVLSAIYTIEFGRMAKLIKLN